MLLFSDRAWGRFFRPSLESVLRFTCSTCSDLSFQIDPALLQQGGLLSQPLSVDAGLVSHSGGQLASAGDPSVSANVVIHPLTSLALQSSAITPAQVTMAALSEQDATGGWVGGLKLLPGGLWLMSAVTEPCFHVDSPGSQDLSHVMGGPGLLSGNAGGQEITLTINNSLTQALANASCSAAAAGNPQEITLTISGMNPLVRFSSIQYSSSCFQEEGEPQQSPGTPLLFGLLEGNGRERRREKKKNLM